MPEMLVYRSTLDATRNINRDKNRDSEYEYAYKNARRMIVDAPYSKVGSGKHAKTTNIKHWVKDTANPKGCTINPYPTPTAWLIRVVHTSCRNVIALR